MRYSEAKMEDLLNIFNFNSYPSRVNLDYTNKEKWNGFILDETAREVINSLDDFGYNVIGFCDAPYAHENYDKAIVLEAYDQDYQIYWCHVSNYLILQWRCSLTGENLYDVIEETDLII